MDSRDIILLEDYTGVSYGPTRSGPTGLPPLPTFSGSLTAKSKELARSGRSSLYRSHLRSYRNQGKMSTDLSSRRHSTGENFSPLHNRMYRSRSASHDSLAVSGAGRTPVARYQEGQFVYYKQEGPGNRIRNNPSVTQQYKALRKNIVDHDAAQISQTTRRRFAGKAVRRPPLTPSSSPKLEETKLLARDSSRHIRAKTSIGHERITALLQESQQPRPDSKWRLKEGPWDDDRPTETAIRIKSTKDLLGGGKDSSDCRVMAWLEDCEKATCKEGVVEILSDTYSDSEED